MQWWIRPGPSRAWAIMKPSPSPAIRFSAGTRTSGEVDFGVALLVLVAEHGQAAQDRDAGRVEWHEDLALLGVARTVERGLAHHDQDPAVAGAASPSTTTCAR